MSVEKFNPTITRESIPYVQINTKVIQNITNAEAGFVWVYLQTLPQDWKVVKSHLRNHFGMGELKMKRIFAFLKKHNLIEYVRERRSNGHLGTTEVRVLNGSRFPFTTGIENHPVVNHTYGFSGTTKNINKQRKEKERKRESSPAQSVDKSKKNEPYTKPINKASTLDDSFIPSPRNIAIAKELGLDIEEEREMFLDYYISKDEKRIEWHRVFNGWLRKSTRFSKKNSQLSKNEPKCTVPEWNENHPHWNGGAGNATAKGSQPVIRNKPTYQEGLLG